MKIILESEQRVGSRWIHYLLSDLYGLRPSPEIDGVHGLIEKKEATISKVRAFLDSNKIVKFHHIYVEEIFKHIQPVDYKVITIGRNPRDRAVSVAFHHKHDPGRAAWPQRGMTDEDAIKYTVTEYDRYPISNARMLSNMKPKMSLGYSKYPDSTTLHRWTTYEWLVENTIREVAHMVNFLGSNTKMSIREAVEKHAFKRLSGREVGEENRTDVWRRKGIVGDYQKWFTPDLLEATEEAQQAYIDRTNQEN